MLRYGIDDSVFIQDNFQVILKNLFQKSVRYLVLAIIALPGEIIHMPLHFFANKLVHNHPYIEEFCQRKFAVLVFCVPLWYSIFSAIIYMLFDSFWFYASLIGFPVFGYIYVMTEEKKQSAAFTVRCILNLITTPTSTLNGIHLLRNEISQKLNELAQELYPNDRIIDRTPTVKKDVTEDNLIHFKAFGNK